MKIEVTYIVRMERELKLRDMRKQKGMRLAIFLFLGFFLISLGNFDYTAILEAPIHQGDHHEITSGAHSNSQNHENHSHSEGHCLSANCYSFYTASGNLVTALANSNLAHNSENSDLFGITVSPPTGPPKLS